MKNPLQKPYPRYYSYFTIRLMTTTMFNSELRGQGTPTPTGARVTKRLWIVRLAFLDRIHKDLGPPSSTNCFPTNPEVSIISTEASRKHPEAASAKTEVRYSGR
jgi:hypothetical protein